MVQKMIDLTQGRSKRQKESRFMSYILDALKKSDRERQRGRAPGLNSIHEPYHPSPEDRSNHQQVKYIFTAIGIILLISIPAITWYSMKDFSNPAPSVKITETTATNTKPEKELLSSAPSTEPLKDNNRTSPPPPSQIPAGFKKSILMQDQVNPPQEEEIAASPPSQKSSEIPDIESLPVSIQTTIPDLNLSGHTYSENPAQRLIIINDTILREGDKLDNTIKLIEITWTGVVLEHNGRQFAVNIE
jgi:general secretion pathway protein B